MSFWSGPRFDWTRQPLVRVIGSVGSWLLLSLSLTVLARGFLDLAAIGTCASDGPFVVASECPDQFDDIAGLLTAAVFIGLAAVVIAALLARGFGTSLLDLAWPILFGGLAVGFFLLYAAGIDGVFLPLGIMMAVMALVPLALALWASPQRVLAGAVNLNGVRFFEREVVRNSPFSVRYERGHPTVRARPGDWALSLGLWLAALGIGYLLGQLVYSTV